MQNTRHILFYFESITCQVYCKYTNYPPYENVLNLPLPLLAAVSPLFDLDYSLALNTSSAAEGGANIATSVPLARSHTIKAPA